MYVGLMFIAGLILVGMMYASFRMQENILKLIVIDFLLYFCMYIFFSGVSFWLDIFRVEYIQIAIILAASIVTVLRRKKIWNLKIDWNIKRYWIPAVIILCAMPCVWFKYEYFGMGQDEGVYQTQAIQFVYDYTDVQRDFEEYELLESDEAKDEFERSLREDLIGLYNYDPALPFASEEKEISEVSAVFHGIPTFSAILALFGKILGITQMSFGQTIFYICSVFLLFFILEKLKVKKASQIVCTVLFSFSPMILWVSKSALTEIILVFLMLGFVYFLMSDEKQDIYWSAIPIVAFSYFHFTIYTMFPAFVLLYMGLYICNRERGYLISAGIINTGFLTGMMMSWMIAGTYTFTYNMWQLYQVLPGANQGNIVWYLWCGCLLIYIFCGILYKAQSLIDKLCHLAAQLKYIIIRLLLIGGVLYQGIIILQYREDYQGCINTFRHLTLAGYGFCVGILLPVAAGILAILFTSKIFKGKQGTIIIGLFIYCILLYSCVMRKNIAYYHYYGRYLAPYLAIVLIFSAMAIELVSARMIYIMGIASLLILLPYERMLFFEKDDTRVTWDVIEKLTDKLEEGDVLLLSREDMKYYYLPLRAITKAYVFPKTENIQKEIEEKYEAYYYIQSDETAPENSEFIITLEYLMSQDNNEYDGKWLPFPLDVTRTMKTVTLWKCTN